jgi:hypothetical protein
MVDATDLGRSRMGEYTYAGLALYIRRASYAGVDGRESSAVSARPLILPNRVKVFSVGSALSQGEMSDRANFLC